MSSGPSGWSRNPSGSARGLAPPRRRRLNRKRSYQERKPRSEHASEPFLSVGAGGANRNVGVPRVRGGPHFLVATRDAFGYALPRTRWNPGPLINLPTSPSGAHVGMASQVAAAAMARRGSTTKPTLIERMFDTDSMGKMRPERELQLCRGDYLVAVQRLATAMKAFHALAVPLDPGRDANDVTDWTVEHVQSVMECAAAWQRLVDTRRAYDQYRRELRYW